MTRTDFPTKARALQEKLEAIQDEMMDMLSGGKLIDGPTEEDLSKLGQVDNAITDAIDTPEDIKD